MWQILNIKDHTTDENLIHYGNKRILNSGNVCHCVVYNCLHLLPKSLNITTYNFFLREYRGICLSIIDLLSVTCNYRNSTEVVIGVFTDKYKNLMSIPYLHHRYPSDGTAMHIQITIEIDRIKYCQLLET
jgi:hypothetical protein